mmetsp:Transcript_51900/g.130324  ORF Transcript_51900/g.130324 Transcript_51900/m.130324 type:complete len:213 (-) Transcript_51900:66-704(-)
MQRAATVRIAAFEARPLHQHLRGGCSHCATCAASVHAIDERAILNGEHRVQHSNRAGATTTHHQAFQAQRLRHVQQKTVLLQVDDHLAASGSVARMKVQLVHRSRQREVAVGRSAVHARLQYNLGAGKQCGAQREQRCCLGTGVRVVARARRNIDHLRVGDMRKRCHSDQQEQRQENGADEVGHRARRWECFESISQIAICKVSLYFFLFCF